MGCHGGFSLDEAVRRTWYNPEEILSSSGLKKGMTFADIGSGEGFFSILAAKVVGETGRVFAVDIDAEAIDQLKLKAAERGLPNLNAVSGEAEKTVFCQTCVDLVFYSMVLHDFHDPVKVLQNAKAMLKPSGVLVDLDWKRKQVPFGPPVQIRFSEEKASELMTQAGLYMVNSRDVGPYHYVVTAKP
jgi:ubiquinone/menaquinone biosynthesis C-methylase UbiE